MLDPESPLAAADDDVAHLDSGDERRLDRLGAVVVDRPAPAAVWPRRDPAAWATAELRFESALAGQGGRWVVGAPLPDPWLVELAGLRLELRPADGGQVGLFAEHAAQWPWLAARVATRAAGESPPRVLHLFGYTGATSLVLAGAGAAVAHVDASRPAVAWARRNAARNGLDGAPIRWLVDDARAFVAREVRRGSRYEGIVLDPPTYGHGPSGRPWRLSEHLDGLLAACAGILADGAFLLLTAHTSGEGADRLGSRLEDALGVAGAAIETGPLELEARSGARLRLGAFARIMGGR